MIGISSQLRLSPQSSGELIKRVALFQDGWSVEPVTKSDIAVAVPPFTHQTRKSRKVKLAEENNF